MDPNEYQRLAMTTANPESRGQIICSALGLAGEAGEFADDIKKVFFQGHEFSHEKATKECGDVLWYLAHACDALGIRLGDLMAQNIMKLRARYPNGFEVEKSTDREEYSVTSHVSANL